MQHWGDIKGFFGGKEGESDVIIIILQAQNLRTKKKKKKKRTERLMQQNSTLEINPPMHTT